MWFAVRETFVTRINIHQSSVFSVTLREARHSTTPPRQHTAASQLLPGMEQPNAPHSSIGEIWSRATKNV
ncbi:hypothetical protein E2C01_082920 [Portunus trituberculatus]|uniref:Uncharacterized protein n=1 Tax=Portunus trituberculatus TaxID=210409 RepID=A0A5B7IR49_PORTR|nr:hypothetical protein [Portunus trituberculatus]